VYEADAARALARARRRLGWCWAEFLDGDVPTLELSGVVHPCLPPGTSVANDWSLRGANAILTGPNAGGKSTLMKAALCSVLLSQTLTVAPCARACRLTPFGTISSHINVVDRTGSASLFQAELARAQRVLGAIEWLGATAPGSKALVVVDEMFSSTNPIEGLAAATACAMGLADAPSALCVISTHHVYLCSLLARAAPGRFEAYGMPVDVDAASGAVRAHPYRLVRGVCRQFVALELLKRAGFGARLVDRAIAVKRALTSSSKQGKASDKEAKQQDEATRGHHTRPSDADATSRPRRSATARAAAP
jgi:DNA mismatch repair ATPase MutS